MLLKIREATANDGVPVRECVVEAFSHYVDRIGKQPAPMLLDFPAEIAAGHIWLAQSNAHILGVLVLYETNLGFNLDTVAVLPHLQGTGIGKALIQFAEQEAVRRGFDSIYLYTNSKMTENQTFYPRIGYVEYERKFESGYERVFYRKKLSEDS